MPASAASPTPNDIEIHVIDASTEACSSCEPEKHLSLDEIARASRFHHREHGVRWAHIRCELRKLLSHQMQIQPSEIQFGYQARGKPFLEALQGIKVPSFNLSHSGELAILAISQAATIGVDIERIRPLGDMDQLVERFFSKAEQQTYWTLDKEEREEAFYTAWTRKEAVIKVEGEGLSLPLDAFDVSLDPRESHHSPTLRSPFDPSRPYRIISLNVAAGYSSAVAIPGLDYNVSTPQVRIRSYPEPHITPSDCRKN